MMHHQTSVSVTVKNYGESYPFLDTPTSSDILEAQTKPSSIEPTNPRKVLYLQCAMESTTPNNLIFAFI